MTWAALVWRNLLRRPARTVLTATGVGLGVALIVALLAIDAAEPPPYDAEVTHGEKVVGRVTSTAPDPEHGLVALAYVRVEVPADAALQVGAAEARPLD